MDPLSLLVLGAAAFGAVATGLVARRAALLTKLKALDVDLRSYRGTIDGCEVTFSRDLLTARIRPPRPLPANLTIQRKVLGAHASWASGDPLFDRAIAIEGEDRWLTARMGAEARAMLLEAAPSAGLIAFDGVVHVGVGLWTSAATMEAALMAGVRLTRLLSEDIDVPEETARNARSDPSPVIRRRCLLRLIRDNAPDSRDVAASLLEDPAPEVRVTAAKHVGARAVDALWELAREGAVPAGIRAEALAAYVQHETFEEARQGLSSLLSSPQPDPVQAAVADGIRQIGDQRFEPHLLAILSSGGPAGRVMAARALGEVGTLAAVETLAALANRRGEEDALRSAARAAATAIQRAGGGEGGRLSVVQVEGAGELSVPGGGEVSVEEEDG